MATFPLDGIRVLELEGIGPGPLGCCMLADFGADVVTVLRAAKGKVKSQNDPVSRGKVGDGGRVVFCNNARLHVGLLCYYLPHSTHQRAQCHLTGGCKPCPSRFAKNLNKLLLKRYSSAGTIRGAGRVKHTPNPDLHAIVRAISSPHSDPSHWT